MCSRHGLGISLVRRRDTRFFSPGPGTIRAHTRRRPCFHAPGHTCRERSTDSQRVSPAQSLHALCLSGMAHTMWQTELVDRSLACKACTQVRPCQAGNALARMRCIRSSPVPSEPSPLDRPCTPSRSTGAGKSHPDTPRTRWTYQPMQRSQACILGTRLPPPDFVQSPLDTQGTLSRPWMAVTFRPDTASKRSPRWHTETSQQCMPHSLPSHSRWCRFPRGMACIESRPRKNRSYSCNTPRPVMDTVPVDMIGMRPGQKKQTWTCSTASKHTHPAVTRPACLIRAKKGQTYLLPVLLLLAVMTPDEMCVLFSSYVAAFVLIWFSWFAERSTPPAPPANVECVERFPATRDRLHSAEHAVWNVGGFLGLRSR